MDLTGTGIAASAAPTDRRNAKGTLLLPGSLPSNAATL